MVFRFKYWNALLALFLVPLLTGCGMVQIEVERTPTPGQNITATVGALRQANQVLSTQVATLVATEPPVLTLQDSSDSIRQSLLESTTRWKTVWVDLQINTYTESDEKIVQHVQAWVSQPTRQFRVIWGRDPGLVEGFAISDGKDVRVMDARTGQVHGTQAGGAPIPGPEGSFSLLTSLAGSLPSQTISMILPEILAGREGSFQPLAVVKLAGREVLEVSWDLQDGQRPDRFWIDTHSGLILRWQNYGKMSGDRLRMDAVITGVAYDIPLPPSMFELQVSELPQFAQDYTGAPVARVETTPDPASKIGEAYSGEMYFLMENPRIQTTEMVQLPSGCLVKETVCPDLGAVRSYPLASGRPQMLNWSPDGKRAFLLSTEAPSRLYIYNPEDGSWQSLVDVAGLEEAVWSPDGRQIAFSVSGDQAGIYLLTVVNGEAPNLTAEKFNTPDMRLLQLSWAGAARLLFAASDPQSVHVYSLDIASKKLDEVMQLPAKGILAPLSAPDGRYWASTSSLENRSQLMIGPPGSQGKAIVSFQQSSIWPLVWSPDGQMLAFSVYGSLNGVDTADLYVVQPDGSALQQIYRSTRIYSFSWAPNAQFLAVEADGEGGWHRIFVVPVSGGSARMIQAPGLRLDTSWVLPSWRK